MVYGSNCPRTFLSAAHCSLPCKKRNCQRTLPLRETDRSRTDTSKLQTVSGKFSCPVHLVSRLLFR